MGDFEKYGILPQKGRKYENIIYVMALIYGLINKEVEAYFRKFNLTSYKFNILTVVGFQNEGKGISQVEIGRRLITTPGNVTKRVEALYKEGLITRVQNPASRRENIIKITPKGRKIIDKLWPQYDALLRSRTDILPKGKQEHLAQTLKNWFLGLQK